MQHAAQDVDAARGAVVDAQVVTTVPLPAAVKTPVAVRVPLVTVSTYPLPL